MKTCRGTQLLSELVAPKAHTQASIAKKLGVTPEAVRHWCTGATKPKDALRKKLERHAGIPASAWNEEIVLAPVETAAAPEAAA